MLARATGADGRPSLHRMNGRRSLVFDQTVGAAASPRWLAASSRRSPRRSCASWRARSVGADRAAELAAAAEGYLAYAGTYEVAEATRTVTHYVEVSL